MQVFYAPDISGDRYVLDENESRHLVRVLRMSKGSGVKLIDGKGNLFEGEIENPDQRGCILRITSVIHDFEKRNYHLHIAISPLKNTERFEWFIEKSVEIGVDIITPVICEKTERCGIRSGRLKNLIISAMKQSLKATSTVLNEPVSFPDFLKCDHRVSAMIAHCRADFERKKITDIYKKHADAVIMIGPEGDFTEREIKMAAANGYEQIHLGPSRLRTETAGIAACHSVYLINQ